MQALLRTGLKSCVSLRLLYVFHRIISHMPKILFLITEDWYFCSHRLPLAKAAKDSGFEIFVATRVSDHGEVITSEGFNLIPIQLVRNGKNPFTELGAIAELVGIYKRVKPDLVHHVAMKPVLYGSIAARLAGVPMVVNALAGMGYLFISSELSVKLIRLLLSKVLKVIFAYRNSRLILQNPDDLNLMVESGLARQNSLRLIRGSGVDLSVYVPSPEPEGILTIVLASRMLWDKGVGEFIESIKCLRTRGVFARFVLVGDTDASNPASIPVATLESWHSNNILEWWGRMENMPSVFAKCHIVCLPSYREGLPKVLLEAAACGRPIVTTDVPGCREIVRHRDNGLLVPVKNSLALADALQQLINDTELRKRMGKRGREIVEQEFSVERVINETLMLYNELMRSVR